VTDPAALRRHSLVAVIGSGTMGEGIAQVAAVSGHPVVLYDTRAGAVSVAIHNIRKNLQRLAEKKKLSPAEAEEAGSRLRSAARLDDLRGASLVIEAVVEDLGIKRQLFSDLECVVDETCLLATNTSSLSVSAIAANLREPGRLVGMHFFNPAPLMELVEIIRGAASNPRAIAQAHETVLAWGKTPVDAQSTPGFIVNRVARPYYAEALILLSERAADPVTVDAVMREAGGFRMGPFELMDLVGLDVGLAVSQSLFTSFFADARYRPSWIQQEMVRSGYLGRKAGRGFYSYSQGSAPSEPQTEPRTAVPPEVELSLSGRLAEAIEKRLARSGVHMRRSASQPLLEDSIVVNGAKLALTDGRTATQRAHESGERNFVVVDLALDFMTAGRVAVAKAVTCDHRAYSSAVGMLQAAGFEVSSFKDVPGLAVMRTVAMLANEAADAVNQGVANATAVDTAMRLGVRYPRGPLAWADDLGLPFVATVLGNLARCYGGERYRVSPLIEQCVWSGKKACETDSSMNAADRVPLAQNNA
jgi:3-hydroxybutyryl-CoA dehydrogenase